MKNFKIKAVPEDREDKIQCSLEISYNGIVYATIWNDERITFNPTYDYDFDELDQILNIGKMFYSFFNNVKN